MNAKSTIARTPANVAQLKTTQITWSIVMSALSDAKAKKATRWIEAEIKKQDSVDVETDVGLRDSLYEMVAKVSSVKNSMEPFRAMLDHLVKLYKAETGVVSIKPAKAAKVKAKKNQATGNEMGMISDAIRQITAEKRGNNSPQTVGKKETKAERMARTEKTNAIVAKAARKAGRASLKATKALVAQDAQASNAKVTRETIFDNLSNQQVSFMKSRKLAEPKVGERALRRFSALAFKAFKQNLRLCKTDRDHVRLFKALGRKLRRDGREFLKARQMVVVKAA